MTEGAAAGRDRKVTVEAIGAFAERIDVRSPSEYAEDHLPGAASHPVLDDVERSRIGSLHAQESAFAARRAVVGHRRDPSSGSNTGQTLSRSSGWAIAVG